MLTLVARPYSIPLIVIHSTGIGTMPLPARSASEALLRSPLVHVKNFVDILTHYLLRQRNTDR